MLNTKLLIDFSVHMEVLGPMLSSIFVSLVPLIDIYPNKVANMFYFMVKENEQHLRNHIAELYFLEPHPANPIVFKIIQKYTKNVLYVFIFFNMLYY